MSCARQRGDAPTWQVSDRAWACESPDDRAGDIDQVKAIAWALDPGYRSVDLATEFERLRRGQHAQMGALELPRFIVGIGRKRIEAAKTIRAWSRGRTRLVHIGRLRGALSDIDYLVTTPAYPVPPSAKVLCLDIALSDRIRRLHADRPDLALASRVSSKLSESGIRSDWINVFIGNPLRGEMEDAAARLRILAMHVNRLAAQYEKDVVISGAPRTRPELYDVLASALTCRHHLYRWTPGDECNPFEIMVRHSRHSIVTADSVSMISQLVAAAHRVLIFSWCVRKGSFVRVFRKLVHRQKQGGKDVAAFCSALCEQDLAAELDAGIDFETVRPRPGIQDMLFLTLGDFVRDFHRETP